VCVGTTCLAPTGDAEEVARAVAVHALGG
jgi:hypothetical protein